MDISGSGHLQIDGDHGRSLSIDEIREIEIAKFHVDIIQRHVLEFSVPQYIDYILVPPIPLQLVDRV